MASLGVLCTSSVINKDVVFQSPVSLSFQTVWREEPDSELNLKRWAHPVRSCFRPRAVEGTLQQRTRASPRGWRRLWVGSSWSLTSPSEAQRLDPIAGLQCASTEWDCAPTSRSSGLLIAKQAFRKRTFHNNRKRRHADGKHPQTPGSESIRVCCLFLGQGQDSQLLSNRDTRTEPAWGQDQDMYSYIVQSKHPTPTQEKSHVLLVGNLYAS